MRYGAYEFVREWPEVVPDVNRAEEHLRTVGHPDAADELLRAYGGLRDSLLQLGIETEALGTIMLRDVEKQERVRHDTSGGGGHRLSEALVVGNLSRVLGPGAYGVANLEVLDDKVPWWPTNEFGSRARVGGRLFGYFYEPGEAHPDSSAFREHALFRSGNSPVSGLGIIKRPIPARHFILKASALIKREWRDKVDVILSDFDTELQAILRSVKK